MVNSLITQIQASSPDNSPIEYAFVNQGIMTNTIYEFRIETLEKNNCTYGVISLAKNFNTTGNYYREVCFILDFK
jgi:hypothetical protein